MLNFILVNSDIDQLNREELLYELDVALQHIETLNQQLKSKFLILEKRKKTNKKKTFYHYENNHP